jgi:hypothetical protein
MPSQSIKTRARNKRNSNREGRSQTILFTDDMILFLKDPKNSNSTKKLLEIKNSFGKVAGYKFNIQKSVGFLHTNSEQIEKEIRETIPFTIASKTIVYIEINVVKETNTFYLFIYLFTYLLSNIF